VESLRRELQQISRIILIRLRSLGDSILTLPLIEALHSWRPELEMSVLIEAPFAPVFLHHPAVAETMILRSRKGTEPQAWTRMRAFRELRGRRYPAVLNLHGGTTSMLLTVATGARMRLGQESHPGSWLYTERIPSSVSIWSRQPLHTVEHQLSLMKWLGLPVPSPNATLHVSGDARARVRERLADAGISEFVLIQPTATLPTKQWEPAKFAELGSQITARYQLPVIYTAAPHETEVLREIEGSAKPRPLCWSDLPLMELFALIESCRLFIGCDSGPTHAAAALKKPVVVVWGSSDFAAWHPWETEYEAVRSDLPCIPCPGYRCKAYGEPKCIRQIPVQKVADACTRILAKTGVRC